MRPPRTHRATLARLAFGAAAAALTLIPLGRELAAAVPAAGLDRALAAQRALIAERPGDARLHEDYGSLLSLADDLEGAELAYREAIALDPASASAHFQLGSTLERRGEERKALKEYRAAIELDENHAWAHYEAGTIWDGWGLDRLARNSYARALSLDPTLADPKINPHILENRHATSAMILAYRNYQPEIAAPRTFHEPARIAALILERPASDDALAAASAGAPAGAAEPRGNASGFSRLETSGLERAPAETNEEPETNEAGEPEARVLTSKDLEPGSSSGQVVGGAVAGGGRSRSTGAESAAERARARAAARQATRPAKETGGMPLPLNPVQGQPGVGIGGGAGGETPFTPGPDSTGRLEIRLDDSAG